MAVLQVVKGVNEGSSISLLGGKDKLVLGRDPECEIHIPVNSISRRHAQIVIVQEKFFIEDLQSRNGTYVNNQAITGRTALKTNDKIRICDFVCAFVDPKEAAIAASAATAAQFEEDDEEEDEGSSTVEAMVPQSKMLLETQPAEKLRGLLEISANLSKTLDIDKLLPKIVDSLFALFKQADRCFLIEADEAGKLIPRVIKTRRPNEETSRFSKSIVRRCLEGAQAFLSDDASKDDRFAMAQSVVDFKIRSVMIVPMCNGEGKAFGVLQLDTQDRSKKFSEDDLKLVWGVANQAAVAMENAKLHESAIKQESVKRDLELAKQVQLSFLPSKLPEVLGYEFWAYYEAAKEVGGDYYGFIPLPTGAIAFALGDVAGKGVPAALLMAKLSSDTRFSVLTEPDAGRAVAKLNDLLYEFTSKMDRFVTLSLAVLDPATHVVTLVSAGHQSPLLYRQADGSLVEVVSNDITGIPLGVTDGFPFESCTVKLEVGDTLLIFTDGVPESMSLKGEPFNNEGIHAALAGAGHPSPKILGEKLVKAVQLHAAGRAAPHDDVTLLLLGRTN